MTLDVATVSQFFLVSKQACIVPIAHFPISLFSHLGPREE